jgi:hypothetical protein
MERRLYRRVPPALAAATGYRYCTGVLIGPGWHEGYPQLLTGDEPYDVDRVRRELAAIGVDASDIAVADRGLYPWRVVASPGSLRQPGYPRGCLAVFRRREYEQWTNVLFGDILYAHRHRQWVFDYPRVPEDEEQDDFQAAITEDQATRIARVLPVPAPDAQERHRMREERRQAQILESEQVNRDWAERRREFAPQVEAFRREGERLRTSGAAPRRRHNFDNLVLYSPAVVGLADLVDLSTLPVTLDEPFPLVRAMVGSFREDTYGVFENHFSNFLANVVRLRVHEESLTLALVVTLSAQDRDALPVTPLRPEEGYPIDSDDADPARRVAKLKGPYGQWDRRRHRHRRLPASPNLLRITAFPGAEDDAVLAYGLWLELTFPGDQRYVAAPYHGSGGQRELVYRRFVPADGPALAEVPGLADSWVSVHVPRPPELLTVVTARLRYDPRRPRPPAPEWPNRR